MLKQKQITKVGKKPLLFAAVIACTLICGVAIVLSCGRKRADKTSPTGELFISIDYRQVINETIRLPFVHEMRGEHSFVKIVLNRLDRVYHHDNNIFVVLEGSAELYGIENNALLETFTAALRFSLKPCCINSALTFEGEPILGKLSVYSTNMDVEAIVERCGSACWKAFCASLSTWKTPLQSMPFTPARRIQLEEDGVFVFEERP